jgi:hypothetical protein
LTTYIWDLYTACARKVLLVYSVVTGNYSLVKLGRSFQSCGLVICVFCLSQVPDIQDTSPPPYCEALHSSTGSTLTEENEPVQQANIPMVSDTRTQRDGENRLSDSCQLRRADNLGYTLHEARQTQHSETELYM